MRGFYRLQQKWETVKKLMQLLIFNPIAASNEYQYASVLYFKLGIKNTATGLEPESENVSF